MQISVPIVLGIALAAGCECQTISPYRFWDSVDGFAESYTSSTATDPHGGLWVKHGDVRRIEYLDGYTVKGYPDPGGLGKLECGPDGTLWMWSGKVLKRLSSSGWSSFPVDEVTRFGPTRNTADADWVITSSVQPYLHGAISVVPLDRARVLIMLPDRVVEFNADRSSSRAVVALSQTGLSRFLTMRAARDGSVWLTGSGGVGRLSRTGQDWRWTPLPRPPLPSVDFTEPFEGQGTDLFVTGAASSGVKAALSYDGRGWKEIYRSDSEMMRAWAGAGGAVWIQDGNRVVEIAAGKKNVTEKTGALSGVLLDVTSRRAPTVLGGQFPVDWRSFRRRCGRLRRMSPCSTMW